MGFVVHPFPRDFVDKDLAFVSMLPVIEQGGWEKEQSLLFWLPRRRGKQQGGCFLVCPKIGVPCPKMGVSCPQIAELQLMVVSSLPAMGLGFAAGGI